MRSILCEHHVSLTQCCQRSQQESPSDSAALQLCMVSETELRPSSDLSVAPAVDRAFHQQPDMPPVKNRRKSRLCRMQVTSARMQVIRR